ncbi:MAG: Ig-like domain-containing protein, partial [Herbinix sp.]|nr:Ig-like domain-containing protein [Herbinix sp.]
MKKIMRIGLFLAICMLITTAIYLSSNNTALASEIIRPDEYFFIFSGQQKKAGTEIEMRSENVILSVSAGTWEPETQVEWLSSEPSVVELEPLSPSSNVKMVRKGPGFSTITAIVKQGTLSYTLSCSIMVNLEFDHQKTGTTIITTNEDRILEISEIGDSKQVFLKYVDYIPEDEAEATSGSAITIATAAVSWESDNESVATVDETGKIMAVGSGSATISVITDTLSAKGLPLIIDLKVVVAPKFSLTFDNVTHESGDDNKNFTPVNDVPSNFVLNSNATYAENLKWEVFDNSTGKKPTNDKMTYTISENSGSVTFSKVKAGTYEIYAYANESYNYNTSAPYAYMKIIVPINLDNENIVMNVGD